MSLNQPEVAYNDLPELPPKNELETQALLKKAIAANLELAELKGYCEKLPNPTLLLNTVVMQESKDSSAIENIVTTQDQLYQAVLNPTENYPFEVKEVLTLP
jgi:Fic family protein